MRLKTERKKKNFLKGKKRKKLFTLRIQETQKQISKKTSIKYSLESFWRSFTFFPHPGLTVFSGGRGLKLHLIQSSQQSSKIAVIISFYRDKNAAPGGCVVCTRSIQPQKYWQVVEPAWAHGKTSQFHVPVHIFFSQASLFQVL